MAKKKKQRKIAQPKVDFAQRLYRKLALCGIGEAEEGALGDDSGRWVNIRIGDSELCFSFDMSGEKIDGIQLFKDKVEVVDNVLVWGRTKP